MTNAFIFNIMLINKCLTSLNYIFPKNTDPLYLRSLVALGCFPIFIHIKDNSRILCLGYKHNVKEYYQKVFARNFCCVTLDNYRLFNFNCCNRLDLKEVLHNIHIIDNVVVCPPMLFKPVYFIDV